MKKFLTTLMVAGATALAATGAQATVLTFDDLGGDGPVPIGYGGLDWSTGDWFVFGEAETPYTPASGRYRTVTGFGDPDAATAIAFRTPAVFGGAWFSGLGGATVTFQLYAAGRLVATSGLLDPSATPRFLASGYAGLVDRVVVSSPAQGSFAMDDFTFAAAVPEPATATLVAGGLVGLVVVRRRRRRPAG